MNYFLWFIFLTSPVFSFAQIHSVQDREPQLIQFDGGYRLFDVDEKTVTYEEWDSTCTSIAFKQLDLPEELKDPDLHFMDDGSFIIMKISDDLKLSAYQFDHKALTLNKKSSLHLNGREEMSLCKFAKWSGQKREDGSFLLNTHPSHSGTLENVGWCVNVFSITKNLDKVLWKHAVEPPFQGSDGASNYIKIKNLSNDEFVIYAMCGLHQYVKKLSYFQYLYRHTDQGLTMAWKHENPFLLEQSYIEGQPSTFLDKDGEFRYYLPIVKNGMSNELILEVRDEQNELVNKIETGLISPSITAKIYVDFATTIFKENGGDRMVMTIEDGRKVNGKNPKYFINLLIQDEHIKEQFLINGENIHLIRVPSVEKAVNGIIVLDDGRIYLNEDKSFVIDVDSEFPKTKYSWDCHLIKMEDRWMVLRRTYSKSENRLVNELLYWNLMF